MFGIALRYGITLEELKTSNPEVNPNFLSIGAVLTIPHSQTPAPGAEKTVEAAAPTAIPVEIGEMRCYRTEDGGAWCFQPVHNTQPGPLESLTAIFRVTENQGKSVVEQTAFLPLDILPPGSLLPLSAYFPPELFEDKTAPIVGSSEMVSALPSPDDGRYIPAVVSDQKVFISENGLSAAVSGQVSLAAADASAARVWVAAVAYNAQGDVIGVRRWENQPKQTLSSQSPLPFGLNIYSASGKIDRVEILAEARP